MLLIVSIAWVDEADSVSGFVRRLIPFSRNVQVNRSNGAKAVIALTREKTKNTLMRELLSPYKCVDVPCIEFEVCDTEMNRMDAELLHCDLLVISSPTVN